MKYEDMGVARRKTEHGNVQTEAEEPVARTVGVIIPGASGGLGLEMLTR